jgi:hypothetical protein
LVRSIADELKPWRQSLKQSQVLAEIKDKIERLKNPTLPQILSRVIGSRRKSREEAKRLRATLKTLERQLGGAGLTFRLVISRQDQVGLWSPKQSVGVLHSEFYELLSAGDKRLESSHLAAAFAARLLMKNLSTKKPTVASEGNSPLCVIASLLFEAVSGERERNLVVACRRVRNLRSEHI